MTPKQHHSHYDFCVPQYSGVGRPPRPWCDRFFDKVEVADNGCWIWIPCKDYSDAERNGHGPVFSVNMYGIRSVIAYKWIYEWEHGEVAAGLELDHKCNNWRCVNWIKCLEPVTPKENGKRYASVRNGRTIRDEYGRFAGRRR